MNSKLFAAGTHRIPNQVYTDPDLYRAELERFFYGPHWSYVGLEAEVPASGDFKTTSIGERPVVMVRDKEGEVRVLENRCRHKGLKFVQAPFGNAPRLICPYHQWCYKHDGSLVGVPLKNGVNGVGGYGSDLDLKQISLGRLRVARKNGTVFATFDDEVEPFDDYLGAELMPFFERSFDGRQLTVLGYNRQRIPGNWKLMQENIKDGYHPGLLHAFFITFGLWRADQKSRMEMDRHGRHAAMISRRNEGGENAEVTKGVTSFKGKLQLADPSLLDVVHEPWWGEHTVVMQTIFPSVIIQQQVNSLSTRQIIPAGPGAFDFVWTHFGYADDTEEMTERRLRQANLFGPAGLVSLDDGEVIEYSQQAMGAYAGGESIVELGGRGTEPAEHMVTETLVRAMYAYYRRELDL
jgi:salicylate 5-hydroxylase large subunit